MGLTRRRFLGGAAGALAAGVGAGVYELVEALTKAPARVAAGGSPPGLLSATVPAEQHVIDNLSASEDGLIIIPARHVEILTGRLRLDATPASLSRAQAAMEGALAHLDGILAPADPSGLNVVVAWGLPFFRKFVSQPAAKYLPVDLASSSATATTTLALVDAVRFPSDPAGLVLEGNDLAVVMRSDHLAHIEVGRDALLRAMGDSLAVTSVRQGFVGGGFGGEVSLVKRMALAAGVPGAASIPDDSELFLGFVSTHAISMGPPRAANLETFPGLTDQWPDGYFCHGTAMHLAHDTEDLVAWYAQPFEARVAKMFRPGITVPAGTQILPQGPAQAEDLAALHHDVAASGSVGHAGSFQPVTRLQAEVTDNYGEVHPAGTSRFQRADSNTVDNPFAYSAAPGADRYSTVGAAGLHFVGFTPTAGVFTQARMAMDAHHGSGPALVADPHAAGINSVLVATHRQNFLVPPRVHRSFPLVELL